MFLLVRILSAIVRVLPEFLQQGICLGLGSILFLIPSKRRIVVSNLAHVFPDRSGKALNRLAWTNCCRTIELGLFALASPGFDLSKIKTRLSFSENFEETYHRVAGDQPMLILLPHNYLNEMIIFVPKMLGLPERKAAAIFRPINQPKLDEWVRSTREQGGLSLLSRKSGLEAPIAHLRGSGHLAILADQSAGDSGILGRVAGRTASLSPFPDLLVRKFPVQLVFVYTERTGFFRGKLHIEVPETRDKEPSALFAEWMTRKLMNDPGWDTNWLWMHRRWKTQRKASKRLRLEQKRGMADDFRSFPKDLSHADRIYLRLPNWLGDIVMVTPLIRAIRKARPDCRLTLVFRPHFQPLIDLLKIPADDLLSADSHSAAGRKLFRARRIDFPDTAILFTNSFRGDNEMRLTGAEQRFGILRHGKRRPLLTDLWKIPESINEECIHQTDLWNQFLAHFGLLEAPDFEPVSSSNSPKEDRIGLFCGSENSPEKRWPIDRWIALVEKILSKNDQTQIDLFGTKGDQTITNVIAEKCKSSQIHNWAGTTDLADLGSQLAHCKLAIGNDTGGMHLANAMGCPTAVLFGPTNPIRTRPIFNAPVSIIQAPDAEPTGKGTMAAIQVEQVFEVISSWV